MDSGIAPSTDHKITTFTSKLWEDIANRNPAQSSDTLKDLMVSRKKVQCAEKMIRGAFVDLYRGLSLLKNYR